MLSRPSTSKCPVASLGRQKVADMEEYYRHFKGNIYKVLHVAKHSETLEEMVVYQAMYGERGVWVRPKAMFEEVIERDGKVFRRFSPISEDEIVRGLPIHP